MAEIQSLWQDLADQFEAQRQQVIQAIRHYPPPIPACDAQFNYLLEQRDALHGELNRLKRLTANTSADALLDFMATSPFIDDALQGEIRLRLETTLTSEG